MPDPNLFSPPLSLAVIIPVYNEKLIVLNNLIRELRSFTHHIILVDDGSNPPLEGIDGSVVLIRHRENLGQGAALETGMEYARRKKFEMVIHIDGDGQHQVQEIPLLLEPLLKNEADIVFGSRFMARSSQALIPLMRLALLKISRIANTFFTGTTMTDAHNGFRALNKKALHEVKLRSTGRAHASEIVWIAHKKNLRILEVPVHVLYNDAAENKIPITTLAGLAFQLTWNRVTGYGKSNNIAVRERQKVLAEMQIQSLEQ